MLLDDSKYMHRLIDPVVESHLHAFGAVEIAGPMWSGKTWTSLRHANSSIRLDVPENKELARLSPETVLIGEEPRLIDEWQDAPQVWDVARHAIDDAGRKGMFILTGSSRPAKDEVSHTGTGRISRIMMRPMTLSESGDSSDRVSLGALFDGKFKPFDSATSLRRIAELVVRGGWPDTVRMHPEDAELVPLQYVDTLVSSEDPKAPESEGELRHFLQALARNIGSSTKMDTLVKDMGYETAGAPKETGRRRVRALVEYFSNRYVIEAMPGWDAPIRSPNRLRVKPRYNFVDPSLPSAILGVNPDALIGNMQLLGQLFEQLCIRDLSVYASVLTKSAPGPLKYYRDADGLEVDVVIELRDGRWGAIEVKLGWNKVKQAEESLLRLKRKVASNPAARNPEPSFMMVLVGKADRAFATENGVFVVPVTSLTA